MPQVDYYVAAANLFGDQLSVENNVTSQYVGGGGSEDDGGGGDDDFSIDLSLGGEVGLGLGLSYDWSPHHSLQIAQFGLLVVLLSVARTPVAVLTLPPTITLPTGR